MAVNGCVFESECLYLRSVPCVYVMLLASGVCLRVEDFPFFFFCSVKGQNRTSGWMCRCLSNQGASLMEMEGSVFVVCVCVCSFKVSTC